MHTVTQRRTIDAPLDDVWAVLDDFGGVANYNPSIERSFITNDVETGEGATRQCDFYGGASIQERITSYEPGVGYDVDFVDVGSFPMKEMRASIRVYEVDAETTDVEMVSRFVPKYGPLGWVMAKLMAESRMERTLAGVLEGLEDHVRTGKPVGQDGVLLDAVAPTSS
ncbi:MULTISPECIES: SRPBCC family protein [Haloferax]|uniref:SRPBCC family protein n=2 Tax=Haloferax TaxID=2251 RepID=A0A6G1YYJ0_9EURY|nr:MULTISPECIES: SRPBCC family protein [Haloferax]KAB1186714.1 SRPBCC family protein [Haloferax sp. CBA1149]MRW79336.1 hypothetical protein [Haloferax marinisediminis]